MAKHKHKGLEYRMLIEPTYDETLKRHGTLFLIETVKQFSNFNYEVVVADAVEAKSIRWALHGLRAPELSMPAFGAAQFRKIYFDLRGKYLFTLRKIDGEESSFDVKISETAVQVAPPEEQSFVTVYASETEFESNRMRDLEKPKHKPDIKRTPAHPPLKKVR